MELRTLGRTGLHVAPICLGGNVFGWTIDGPTSFKILDAYTDGGGNFIDTADVYSRWAPGNTGGESEVVIGNWLQGHGGRDGLIIASKGGSPMGDDPNMKGLSRRRIIAAVDASLGRLKTDYIDLYQSHQDDRATPLEETLRAYSDLIQAGKIRYIGASNYSAWRLTRALWESDRHGFPRYETIQPPYHLLNRADYERELEPMCQELGVGVITYSSLASGFLTGKYRRDGALPSSQRAGGIRDRYMNDRGFGILDAVEGVAKARGATPTQVALAWILARPGMTAPIASATSVEQVGELLGAADLHLSDDDLKALDTASAWK
ncbi:MAG: Aldo/keto reductase, SCO4109 family [uncultured Thermomicrobiales bacterium]|uniref:Aldo/keto reductase, SCO4109 family n=1 Tax=uncultured Thermomicrobiales bacterium TaxID=1645740 RepID=A0A6J4VN88_9BACT|nr:MAG: Aldo/keto reductase, SCO4109 family [uncultured Thermomicrobiales bacterium]